MKTVKTTKLTGAALDWAVAKCEGWKDWEADDEAFTWAPDGCGWLSLESYKPSTDWAQGGPIIERECIFIAPTWDGETAGSSARASRTAWIEGPTPLIAAMRCHVASKLGEDVSIPEVLLP